MKFVSEEQHIPQRLRYRTCSVSTGVEQLNFASEQKKQDKLLACRGWLTNDTPDSLRVCHGGYTHVYACACTHAYIHTCMHT